MIRYPSERSADVEKVASAFKLARHCADQQFNNFLVGEGAAQFAVQSGMEMMELLTLEAQMIYEQRRRSRNRYPVIKGMIRLGLLSGGQGTLGGRNIDFGTVHEEAGGAWAIRRSAGVVSMRTARSGLRPLRAWAKKS